MMKALTKTTFRYFAFGLQIESEISLPELLPGEGDGIDVTILNGIVPEKLENPMQEGSFFQSTAGEFLFRVKGIADYFVAHGNQIVVQPHGEEHSDAVRIFLLGTSMGLLLMQRGMAAMHGSTMSVDGRGIMLAGLSGAGKSTLAAALRQRGHILVADDVSALSRNAEGCFSVQPGYPQQKLGDESADMVGLNTEGYKRVFDRNKFAVPVVEGFCRQPVSLDAIFVLAVDSCDDVSVKPLTGAEKLAVLIGNTYRVEFLAGQGIKVLHFQHCAALAKQTPVFEVVRPKDGDSLERQVGVVLKQCGELQVSAR